MASARALLLPSVPLLSLRHTSVPFDPANAISKKSPFVPAATTSPASSIPTAWAKPENDLRHASVPLLLHLITKKAPLSKTPTAATLCWLSTVIARASSKFVEHPLRLLRQVSVPLLLHLIAQKSTAVLLLKTEPAAATSPSLPTATDVALSDLLALPLMVLRHASVPLLLHLITKKSSPVPLLVSFPAATTLSLLSTATAVASSW